MHTPGSIRNRAGRNKDVRDFGTGPPEVCNAKDDPRKKQHRSRPTCQKPAISDFFRSLLEPPVGHFLGSSDTRRAIQDSYFRVRAALMQPAVRA
jgi:hypothetical protein